MTMESKLLQQTTGSTASHQQQGHGQISSFNVKMTGNTNTAISNQTVGTGKMFVTTMLEPRDDLDDRHIRCYNLVMNLIGDKSEKEAHDALSSAVSKDPKTHEEVCLGFVVGILTHQATINAGTGMNGSNGAADQELPARYYRDLTLVARDGLQCVLGHLTHLATEKYLKMLPAVKQQLMWLIRELIRNNVQGMDNVCWNLMRQIAGGDVSRNNLWLADIMVDILAEHRAWVEKYPFLVASVVYTFLRLIEDHTQPQYEKIRDKEVKFVIGLIRDKFNDVVTIGRDLVRLLQYVAKIPEFETLWRDILYKPKSLSPTFSGFAQLMQTRTSRRFLQSRITPEMEKKMVFFTGQVQFGNHKRYQDWFQQKYLYTQESQSLRCDLIRYLIGFIHPTNEVLCSNIIPRWALIGWLLKTCTSQVTGSNVKLALFYDWLFFDPAKDNIMNIEPAILLMNQSIRAHPAITASLLDFLCRIMINFTLREQEKVKAGIFNALHHILDKKVIPSLSPLFDNPSLDKELRCMLRERCAPFCSAKKQEYISAILPTLNPNTPGQGTQLTLHQGNIVKKENDLHHEEIYANNSSENEEPAEFSDDDVHGDLNDILNDLKSPNSNCERKCEAMDQLVKHVIFEELDNEQCSGLASSLADILQDQFEGRIFPETPTAAAIEDSIGKPLFIVFRVLCGMADSDTHRVHILKLLTALYTLRPRLGYCILYWLNATSQQNPMMLESVSVIKSKANVYRNLCEAIDKNNGLDICLVNDMRQCQEDDVNLFIYLLPYIYKTFPTHAEGNINLLYLVVSCVDGKQVLTLVSHVVARDFSMFKKDSIQAILTASLGWETFEQYALWQLIYAHDLPFDCVLPIVPKLNADQHSEALTGVLLMIRQERPTAELLEHLMAREVCNKDRFVSSCLVNWMHEYEDKLGDLLSNHLCKAASDSTSIKKTTGINSILSNSAERTLAHLDQLRQRCTQYDFFDQSSIQSALQQVRHSCTESEKKKFMDLFALADTDSEYETSVKSGRNGVSVKYGDQGSGSGENGKHSHSTISSSKKSSKAWSKLSSPYGNHPSSHRGSHHSFSSLQKTRGSSNISNEKLDQSENSEAASNTDEENEKSLNQSKKAKGNKRGNKSSNNLLHKNPRKRGRITYKDTESTDESSDDYNSEEKILFFRKLDNPDSD